MKALDSLNVKMNCMIATVAHDTFGKIQLEDVKKFMNGKPVIVDVRGMFSGEAAKREGFYYRGL